MSTNTDVLHAGVCSYREENIHECVLESSLKCNSEHHTETQLAISQNDSLHRHERERDCYHLRVLVLFRSEETENCFQRIQ